MEWVYDDFSLNLSVEEIVNNEELYEELKNM